MLLIRIKILAYLDICITRIPKNKNNNNNNNNTRDCKDPS